MQRCGVQPAILDVLQLLLKNCTFATGCLSPNIVGQHNSKAMITVCIKQSGAQEAQSPVVDTALFHIPYQFAKGEQCGASRLMAPNHFMTVIGSVSAYASNFLPEPQGQISGGRISMPVHPHFQQASSLHFLFVDDPYHVHNFVQTHFCG